MDMLIVLDNAESVLDPHPTSAEEICAAVEELSQLGNICLCITTRISTFPPDFEWLDIPPLSKEAGCDTFHRIYKHGGRSGVIDDILEQLDFHPLSITLLATVAHHNRWDTSRLVKKWGERRTDMAERGRSLSATIELSLSSSIFQELGPDARDLLGVVAFFPQGVGENKIDWLFPTTTGREKISNGFCVLSLAYRSDGFVTMLAPICDYLSPKECYFGQLSVDVYPGKPGFESARWITSEDVNVEHLLDVFITIGMTSGGVWGACARFMQHLFWHKPRLVMLRQKIEGLADDYLSKLECLFHLSRLSHVVGNYAESKRLLTHAIRISREQGDDHQLARTLRQLSVVHYRMRLLQEGMQLAKESSEIYKRLGDTVDQAQCLIDLGWLLHEDSQPNDAEEAVSHTIDLLPETGEQFQLCRCHHLLGSIYRSKGKTKRATHHLDIALGIASPFNWVDMLFWIRCSMAVLSSDECRSKDAHAHIEHARLHATNGNSTYFLARAMRLRAHFWHKQRRFREAKFDALDAFEKFGAVNDVESVQELPRQTDRVDRSASLP